jgi:hypothetical protein
MDIQNHQTKLEAIFKRVDKLNPGEVGIEGTRVFIGARLEHDDTISTDSVIIALHQNPPKVFSRNERSLIVEVLPIGSTVTFRVSKND